MTVGDRRGRRLPDHRRGDRRSAPARRSRSAGSGSRFRCTARTRRRTRRWRSRLRTGVFSLSFEEIALELAQADARSLAHGAARDRRGRDRAERRVQREPDVDGSRARRARAASTCPPARAGSRCSATCASSARITTTRTARWGSGPPRSGSISSSASAPVARRSPRPRGADGVDAHVVADAAGSGRARRADGAPRRRRARQGAAARSGSSASPTAARRARATGCGGGDRP